MADTGHGVQMMNITENHTFELDIPELEKLLLNNEIKDLPVVVVSVAGAYRGGKSFLLNFFIRYLESSDIAREDGSWLGEDSESLTGFKWRSGSERTTTGILMWSKPFIYTLPNGDKVAVLLMDTQGTFDNKSTVRDCSTIFGLSTLLSSVQIYNLSHNIAEDDLQHLELFTEYGKMVKDEGSKAFQVLEFLVRDWQFFYDYPYGEVGGQKLIDERLKITPNLPKEMQDLRRHIITSFEKVSCFLMPHPGFKVLRKNFSGKISEIEVDFRTYLKVLVKSLFGKEKLMPKTMNGQQIKARDMFNYFKSYMELFNSDKIPNPKSILEATVEAGLLSALNESRELYEKKMDAACGPNELGMPTVDLQLLHTMNASAARDLFNQKKKMGSKEQADIYLVKLNQEMEQRLPQFIQGNNAKVKASINKAKEAYEEAVRTISKDQSLCVHQLDVEKVHKIGLNAAKVTFDRARKRITDKPDDERTVFIQSFDKQYSLLKITNDQNNSSVVSTLRMEYWQYMHSKCALDPPLSYGSYRNEHEYARSRALENFDSKRNIPSSYAEDFYKEKLTSKIMEVFYQLQSTNSRKLEQIRIEEEMRAEEERQRRERERLMRQRERELADLRERQRREWERYLEDKRRRENEKKCVIL